ncbi:hypothetical protein ZIOFF_060732 [Zingiber officinale]|uniref:Uncharacterized protein n=1 Tax=Zingiber officinale TaxID=94328 RepID=A0A8J5FPG3_ZINOF|nr:hypothetical protein ZIOFF_060732 [Zingiber officinale]
MKMGQRIPATGRHSHMAEIHDHASHPLMADAQRRTISSGNSQDYIHSLERKKDTEELYQDSEHETVEELTSMQKLEIEDNYSERKTPGEEESLVSAEALTRARVPIVKLMDPVTGLSCDICVNNLLAVVNTKLLKDYAQIDERLRQLAFIVVVMCIPFCNYDDLQFFLVCRSTLIVLSVENTKCTFFDQMEMLRDFGIGNKESIARLLWAFFHYWAYHHDYTNDVISIRTGSIIR